MDQQPSSAPSDNGQESQNKPPVIEGTQSNNEQQSGGAAETTGIERSRLIAALSYLGVLVIIPLLLVDKNNPFVKFHAKQGLVILIGFIIASISVSWIPILGNLVWLVLALASVAGLIQALQGKLWRIPVVADIADKFKI